MKYELTNIGVKIAIKVANNIVKNDSQSIIAAFRYEGVNDADGSMAAYAGAIMEIVNSGLLSILNKAVRSPGYAKNLTIAIADIDFDVRASDGEKREKDD